MTAVPSNQGISGGYSRNFLNLLTGFSHFHNFIPLTSSSPSSPFSHFPLAYRILAIYPFSIFSILCHFLECFQFNCSNSCCLPYIIPISFSATSFSCNLFLHHSFKLHITHGKQKQTTQLFKSLE